MPPGPVIVSWARRPADLSRSVLTDRDGVLVEVASAPDGRSAAHPLPNIAGALATLRRAGYGIVVVTNQGSVSRGTTTRGAMLAQNADLLRALDVDRKVIDYVVVCPHTVEDGCDCRKPRTGGVRALERKVGQRITEGWFIGDQRSDLECGRTLGLRTVLVATGRGASTWNELRNGDRHVVDLRAATFLDIVGRLPAWHDACPAPGKRPSPRRRT